MKYAMMLAALAPSVALAHSGDHSHTGPAHMLSAPDHFVSLLLLAAVVALLGWLMVRR